jgi:IPT/TIG domain
MSPTGRSRRYVFFPPDATPAPRIDSITPDQGGPGAVVVISGDRLGGATEARFGAEPATVLGGGTNTRFAVTAPAGPSGTVDVAVRTPEGEATLRDGFTYT